MSSTSQKSCRIPSLILTDLMADDYSLKTFLTWEEMITLSKVSRSQLDSIIGSNKETPFWARLAKIWHDQDFSTRALERFGTDAPKIYLTPHQQLCALLYKKMSTTISQSHFNRFALEHKPYKSDLDALPLQECSRMLARYDFLPDLFVLMLNSIKDCSHDKLLAVMMSISTMMELYRLDQDEKKTKKMLTRAQQLLLPGCGQGPEYTGIFIVKRLAKLLDGPMWKSIVQQRCLTSVTNAEVDLLKVFIDDKIINSNFVFDASSCCSASVCMNGGMCFKDVSALWVASRTMVSWKQEKTEKVVELLLSHGADVNHFNKRYSDSNTALQCACRVDHSNAQVVKLLLSHGADPWIVNEEYSMNPLMIICDTYDDGNFMDIDDCKEIIDSLIKSAGADYINMKCNEAYECRTALMMAQSEEVIGVLMQHNARLDESDINGLHTWWHVMPLLRRKDLLLKFLDKQVSGLDIVQDVCSLEGNCHGKTSLQIAMDEMNFELVKFLIENGADIKSLATGTSIWQRCILPTSDDVNAPNPLKSEGGRDFVSFMLDNIGKYGIEKFDEPDEVKSKMLLNTVGSHYAFVKLLRFLIDQQVDVNAKYHKKLITVGKTVTWTFLMKIIFQAQNRVHPATFEMVKVLVETGKCDINAKDSRGDTALHHLARAAFRLEDEEHDDMVTAAMMARYLIENGADIGIANEKGLTPLMLLKPAPAHVLEFIKVIFDCVEKVDLKMFDSVDGKSLLHRYVDEDGTSQLMELLKYLAGLGFDFNCVDKEGKTSLICAVENYHANLFEALVKAGTGQSLIDNCNIDLSHRHKQTGKTAVGYLVEMDFEDWSEVPGQMMNVLVEACKGQENCEILRNIDDNENNVLMKLMASDFVSIDSLHTMVVSSMEEMLEKRLVNVNETNKEGQTALMMIGLTTPVFMCDKIQLLIENGADVNIRDVHGDNAVDKFMKLWRRERDSDLKDALTLLVESGTRMQCIPCTM